LTGTNVRSNPDRALLEELGALAAKGELIVPIQQIYPLDDVVEALATARDGHTRGKSVVAP
jgi:NADPH:quinone reductase-like Zn-dependent oxidoreductase